MKNLTGIITAVLIVLFFGFLVMQNCDCCKSTCSKEKAEPQTAQTIDAADSTKVITDTTAVIDTTAALIDTITASE